MPVYEYPIISNCTSTSYDHYHSVALSDINNALRNNIPNYAWIYNAKVYLKMNHSSVLGTLGNADVNIWFCNNGDDNSGTNLLSGTTSVNPKEFPVDITSYVSNIHYPFTISCSSYSRLAVYYDSTTRRKYNCEVFKVVVEYRIPSYIIQVNATEGGTASCNIDIRDYLQHGTQAVITATPNTGYKFVKWSDGNTSATRTITVTSNATYTAVFERIAVYVTYDSIFSFKRWAETNLSTWDLMQISNVTDAGFTGTALVEDAYTTECRPLIPVEAGKTYTFECDVSGGGFEFFVFNCNSSGGWADFTYGNTKKFDFIPSTNYVSIRCDVVGTGTVANFSNFRIYPSDRPYMSTSVSATERTDLNNWSMPTPTREGYNFKGWNTKPDGTGITYTSGSAYPTSDLVLYSQWEVAKINKIIADLLKSKKLIIDFDEIKAIKVDTTKVYG